MLYSLRFNKIELSDEPFFQNMQTTTQMSSTLCFSSINPGSYDFIKNKLTHTSPFCFKGFVLKFHKFFVRWTSICTVTTLTDKTDLQLTIHGWIRTELLFDITVEIHLSNACKHHCDIYLFLVLSDSLWYMSVLLLSFFLFLFSVAIYAAVTKNSRTQPRFLF